MVSTKRAGRGATDERRRPAPQRSADEPDPQCQSDAGPALDASCPPAPTATTPPSWWPPGATPSPPPSATLPDPQPARTGLNRPPIPRCVCTWRYGDGRSSADAAHRCGDHRRARGAPLPADQSVSQLTFQGHRRCYPVCRRGRNRYRYRYRSRATPSNRATSSTGPAQPPPRDRGGIAAPGERLGASATAAAGRLPASSTARSPMRRYDVRSGRLFTIATAITAVVLACGAAAFARSSASRGASAPAGGLAARARRRRSGCGSAPRSSRTTSTRPPTRPIAGDQFSTVTPGNEMKWQVVEPTRGHYDWSGGDRLVAFAQAHGQLVRGHTLRLAQPAARLADHRRRRRHDQQQRAATACCTSTSPTRSTHFKGKIWQWDVANEFFTDSNPSRPQPERLLDLAPGPGHHRRRLPLGARGRPARRCCSTTTTTSPARTARTPRATPSTPG